MLSPRLQALTSAIHCRAETAACSDPHHCSISCTFPCRLCKGGAGVYESSTFDIAAHYQREVLPLRKIITEEMQLRFSSMQIDVFALLTEARQRLASLRSAIDAKRNFWLAQAELNTAVNGGGVSTPDPSTRGPTTAVAGGH